MAGEAGRSRTALWPWVVTLTAAGAAVAALVLRASDPVLAAAAGELYLADLWISVVVPPLGAFLWTRTRARLLGLVLLSTALVGLGSAAALYALHDVLHGNGGVLASAAAWLPTWTWTPYLLLVATLPLLMPDGQPASRAWRRVTMAGVATVSVTALLASLSPGPIEPYDRLTNPLGSQAMAWLPTVGDALVAVVVVTFLALGVVSTFLRWRSAHTEAQRRRFGVMLAAVGVFAVSVLGSGSLPYPWIDLVPALGLTVLIVALVAAVTTAEAADETTRSRKRLLAAREDERLRLHRDLHDGLGPELAGLALHLNAIGTAITDDGTRAQLAGAEQTLRRAVEEVRRIVDGLRPPALDQLGLVSALRQRAASLAEASGVAFEVQATDAHLGQVSTAVEVSAYRIACEAMTNVVRHAGASRCVVRLDLDRAMLVVRVADDGTGATGTSVGGVGSDSMRARAEELGGWMSRGAGLDGTGLQVAVSLPLEGA